MSAVASADYDERGRSWAAALCARYGRDRAARAIGVSADQLDNLLSYRRKSLSARLLGIIREAYIDELTREARELDHAVERARLAGIEGQGDAVREAEAALAQGRAALARLAGGASQEGR